LLLLIIPFITSKTSPTAVSAEYNESSINLPSIDADAPINIPFVSEFAFSNWFALIFLLLIPASAVFVLNKK